VENEQFMLALMKLANLLFLMCQSMTYVRNIVRLRAEMNREEDSSSLLMKGKMEIY
jgi:hypothetical protein